MNIDPPTTYTVFAGPRRLASGPLGQVALSVIRAGESAAGALVFSDETGTQVELDLRGGEAGVLERYGADNAPPESAAETQAPARGRGRPRMGVVPREVTLLPQHWEWLASQPGGASVTLRKLVHDAMRAGAGREARRRAQERSYRVMVSLAGDRPGFEEAARALFAGDIDRLRTLVNPWPRDIREHVVGLAEPDSQPKSES